jgi:hypothetical protein
MHVTKREFKQNISSEVLGKLPLGRPRQRRENNTKICPKEGGYNDVDCRKMVDDRENLALVNKLTGLIPTGMADWMVTIQHLCYAYCHSNRF